MRFDSSQAVRNVAVLAAAMLLFAASARERASGGEPFAVEAPAPVPGMPGFAAHHQRAVGEVRKQCVAAVVVGKVMDRTSSDSCGRGRMSVVVEEDCAVLGLRRGRRVDMHCAADREHEVFGIDAGFEAVAVGDRCRFLVERKWMQLLLRLLGETNDAAPANASAR